MNRKTKIWLCVAAALILIGCIIFAGAMMALKWDFTKLSTVEYETNEYTISEHFDNISILTDTADITFLPSDSKETIVVCKEQENIRYSVMIEDGTLKIALTDTRKWYEYIGINFGTSAITVYLPEAEYGTLYIKESTGNIEVPNAFSFESIDISASTGSVKNYASAAEGIKIKTSAGDIVVENVSAAALDLSVSTGMITASSVNCKGDVTLKVSTGETSLTNITCQNLTSSGDTGKIRLTNVYAEGSMQIERSTGDVTFENADAASIYVETDTGDVRGTLHSVKTFYASSGTGKVIVPKTSGGICEIKTDTGDIIIELATY